MGTKERAPLDAAALGRVLAPFGRSTTLPGEAYTSDEVFAWERRNFFDGGWVCVGRTDDLPSPGDRRALSVGTEGIILSRDESGVLHAFYNVCRHRGHELVEPGTCVNSKVIKCPYHAWVYGADGSLRGAPHFGDVPDFDRKDYTLVEARLDQWHGWLFVNASGDGMDLSDYIGNLDEYVSDYEPERLIRGARHEYVLDANWKIVHENYHECYHCSNIHPELCQVTPPDSGENATPNGAWVGGSMDLMEHATTMSLTGESYGEMLRGLDERRRRQVFYFGLLPNLLISLHPDYVLTHRIEPLAKGRSYIECEWLFAPESFDRADFDATYASDFWDITNLQDWSACESVYKGVSSRGFRQGPLAVAEDAVYQFMTMVARGYSGDDPRLADRHRWAPAGAEGC